MEDKLYTGNCDEWPPGLYVAQSYQGKLTYAIVQAGLPVVLKIPVEDEWCVGWSNHLGFSYKRIASL